MGSIIAHERTSIAIDTDLRCYHAIHEANNRGWAAVDQRIAYKREAMPGDVLTIRSALLEVKQKSVRFVHEMKRGEAGDHLATMLAADPTAWNTWPPERGFIE